MNRSNKRHLYTLIVVAIISLITLALVWWINIGNIGDKGETLTTATTDNTAVTADTTKESSMNVDDLKPRTVQGTVTKTLEQFSLTADSGEQYHINDPSQLLDKLAKQRGIEKQLYTLENVTVEGIVSSKGNYGHLGYYEYQLTVVGFDEK